MKEEKSYLPLLDQLTANLSRRPHGSPGQIIYSTPSGLSIIGQALYKVPEVAIQNVFLLAGADFPGHTHNEKEWLVCYEGRLKFECGGEETFMEPGSCRFIAEHEQHTVTAIKDSRVIAITIPASPGFPDV